MDCREYKGEGIGIGCGEKGCGGVESPGVGTWKAAKSIVAVRLLAVCLLLRP